MSWCTVWQCGRPCKRLCSPIWHMMKNIGYDTYRLLCWFVQRCKKFRHSPACPIRVEPSCDGSALSHAIRCKWEFSLPQDRLFWCHISKTRHRRYPRLYLWHTWDLLEQQDLSSSPGTLHLHWKAFETNWCYVFFSLSRIVVLFMTRSKTFFGLGVTLSLITSRADWLRLSGKTRVHGQKRSGWFLVLEKTSEMNRKAWSYDSVTSRRRPSEICLAWCSQSPSGASESLPCPYNSTRRD